MDRPKPSCCRRLFDADGTPPPREIPEMDAGVAEYRQRARERWNFDFENDVPLEGRYEWVRVAPPSPPPPAPEARGAEGRRSGAGEETQQVTPQISSSQVAGEGNEGKVSEGQELEMEAVISEGGEQTTNTEQAHE